MSCTSRDLEDFSIPELPGGQNMVINIKTTWGDRHYVGLSGIEIFADTGQPVPVAKVFSWGVAFVRLFLSLVRSLFVFCKVLRAVYFVYYVGRNYRHQNICGFFCDGVFCGLHAMMATLNKAPFRCECKNSQPFTCRKANLPKIKSIKSLNFYTASTSQANRRHMMAETSHSVHCMRCRTVRSLACFVGISWRAEQSDSQMIEVR